MLVKTFLYVGEITDMKFHTYWTTYYFTTKVLKMCQSLGDDCTEISEPHSNIGSADDFLKNEPNVKCISGSTT